MRQICWCSTFRWYVALRCAAMHWSGSPRVPVALAQPPPLDLGDVAVHARMQAGVAPVIAGGVEAGMAGGDRREGVGLVFHLGYDELHRKDLLG